MPLISSAAIGTIGIYQLYISPYKGFRCAHRAHLGGMSCSEFAKESIRIRSGVFAAFPLIKERLIDCRKAHTEFQKERLQLMQQEQAEGDAPKEKPSPATKQGDTCVNICTLPCL